MSTRGAHLAGWSLIAAATALLFLLDHLRTLHIHFTGFMALLLALSAGLVAAVVYFSRCTSNADQTARQQELTKGDAD